MNAFDFFWGGASVLFWIQVIGSEPKYCWAGLLAGALVIYVINRARRINP